MNTFIQLTISGIALGSIYALTAIGYSLVYGILELVNFTHGTIYMIGAYMFYVFAVMLDFNWAISLALAILIAGIIGIVNERLTIKPLRDRKQPKFAMLICTIGTSIVLQNIFFLLLGSETKQYPTIFEGRYIKILNTNISYIQLIIPLLALILLVILTLFIKKSKFGIAMRATSQDVDAAELVGISVDSVISMTFFIGSALATIAGVLGCMSFRNIDISVGVSVGTKTFAATVLGGIGVFSGAVLGGLIIGVTEMYTAGYISSNIRDVTAFVALIVVLLIKPNGLLGKTIQKKV